MFYLLLAFLFEGCLSATVRNASTTTTTTTTRPVLPQPSQQLNIYDSAIFVCGNLVYQDSISMVFPPSDVSLQNIVNATRAEIVHRQSYVNFCDKLYIYVPCVKELVKRNLSVIDSYVQQYIDFENFNTALYAYCPDNTTIPSQFMCTKQTVEAYSCPNGGLFGIMNYVANAITNEISKEDYCSGLQKSVRCRVDKQLKKCSKEYGEVMDFVYMNFTSRYCQQ